MPVRAPLAPEDQARADCYALFGRMFSRPPDAALLAALAGAPRLAEDGVSAWPAAFNRMADASSAMDAEAADQEFTELFVGVGKSEVDLHASHWMTTAMSERPLAELRGVLAGLGLGRQADASLLEDHLGPLLETMRLLVAGGPGFPPVDAARQQAFFDRWVGSWTDVCCTAIVHSSIANYYRRVAECAQSFLALERDAFAMDR